MHDQLVKLVQCLTISGSIAWWNRVGHRTLGYLPPRNSAVLYKVNGFDQASTGKSTSWKLLIDGTTKCSVPACGYMPCHTRKDAVVLRHRQDLMQKLAKQHGGSLSTSLTKVAPSSRERARSVCLPVQTHVVTSGMVLVFWCTCRI